MTAPSTRRSEIPPELDAIVMKLLAKLPENRFQSADEVLASIEEIAATRGSVMMASAVGRFLREMFGQKPEPWVEMEASETLVPVTVSSEPIPRDLIHTNSNSVDLMLQTVRERGRSGRAEPDSPVDSEPFERVTVAMPSVERDVATTTTMPSVRPTDPVPAVQNRPHDTAAVTTQHAAVEYVTARRWPIAVALGFLVIAVSSGVTMIVTHRDSSASRNRVLTRTDASYVATGATPDSKIAVVEIDSGAIAGSEHDAGVVAMTELDAGLGRDAGGSAKKRGRTVPHVGPGDPSSPTDPVVASCRARDEVHARQLFAMVAVERRAELVKQCHIAGIELELEPLEQPSELAIDAGVDCDADLFECQH